MHAAWSASCRFPRAREVRDALVLGTESIGEFFDARAVHEMLQTQPTDASGRKHFVSIERKGRYPVSEESATGRVVEPRTRVGKSAAQSSRTIASVSERLRVSIVISRCVYFEGTSWKLR